MFVNFVIFHYTEQSTLPAHYGKQSKTRVQSAKMIRELFGTLGLHIVQPPLIVEGPLSQKKRHRLSKIYTLWHELGVPTNKRNQSKDGGNVPRPVDE